MTEHRTYLTNLLESAVVNERNQLSEKIAICNERGCAIHISEQLDAINKWESDSIELVKQSAALARKRSEELAMEHFNSVKGAFTVLSDRLHRMMEEESFFEKDIKQLEQKFQKLKLDMENFSLEAKINTLPDELIDVRSRTTSEEHSMKSVSENESKNLSKTSFIDYLVTMEKPSISINLSLMKPGRILPINSQSIGFLLENRISALNPYTNSWTSICSFYNENEVHWSDHLQVFLFFTIQHP